MLEGLEPRVLLATFPVTSAADSGPATLRQAILDANSTPGADTIVFNIAGDPRIQPLTPLDTITEAVVIDGTTQPGYTGTPVVWIDGLLQGLGDGLTATSGNVTVRGVVVGNFLSGVGVKLDGGDNRLESSYIGVDRTGLLAIPNAYGVVVSGGSNAIGAAGAGNVISGNFIEGLTLAAPFGLASTVQGNRIGTDPAGILAIPNSGNGIYIGQTVGTASSYITVGGTNPGEGNIIAANFGDGVRIENVSDNLVIGNTIGTDASGTLAMANFGNGVMVMGDASSNVIGGVGGSRNLISGNQGDGVRIATSIGTVGNVVAGNYIGTDAAGTVAIGNLGSGVRVGSAGATVGGAAAGMGNVISGNSGNGVSLQSSALVLGNRIGTSADGLSAIPNADGIYIDGNNNIVGGTLAGEANLIAFNQFVGISVFAGSGNQLRGNSIHSNGQLGIDLALEPVMDGITPNDPQDVDSGPNLLQNYPVLVSAAASGGGTNVIGSLNSTPLASFVVDFYASTAADPTGFGEGQTWLASSIVVTDANGDVSFSLALPAMPPGQSILTATATDGAGNTSEFSAAIAVSPQTTQPTTTDLVATPNPSIFGQNVLITATVTPGVFVGVPTGTVEFFDGAMSLGIVPVDGAGQAMLSTAGLSVGLHSLTATYSGDSLYDASSGMTSQQVDQASTLTGVTSSLNPSIVTQPVTFTATVTAVTPGAGVPTGTVTFKDGATVLGVVALAGGQAQLTTSALVVGGHGITAEYSGDGSFLASTGGMSQQVDKAPTTTALVATPNPSIFGQNVLITATVTPGVFVGVPTGTIQFYDGMILLASVPLDGAGQASLSIASLTAGPHTLTATYWGDGVYLASNGAIQQIVQQAGTMTSLSSALNPSIVTQPVTFTATVTAVTPGAGVPTGTVTFKDGATVLGVVALAGGQAQLTTSALVVGGHGITAEYSGDGSFLASTGGMSQQVDKAPTTTALVATPNPSIFGQNVLITATVTPGVFVGVPTGTIQFYDGMILLASVPLDGAGQASFSTSLLAPGMHTLTANYNGSAVYAASTGVTQQQVEQAPAAIGNFVWEDLNADGIQQPGEPGIQGVLVSLVDEPTNAVVAITFTDVAGGYHFDVDPGTYRVWFWAPAGYELTQPNVGADDADSDALATGLTDPFTLAGGEVNNTIDAGFWRPASIGNFAWEDLNANGIQDANEPGLARVKVQLLRCADDSVVALTVTDADGKYAFGNLEPGDYKVVFHAPPGYNFTDQNVGMDDSVDSDADPATGMTTCVSVVSGEQNDTVDAGLWRAAVIGNYVWADDGDGIQDPGEAGVAGVPVSLLSCVDDSVVATTTTDAAGMYTFNVRPGAYKVQFGLPGGYDRSPMDQGGDDTADSDADPMTGLTSCFAVISGEVNDTIDAGLIALEPNVVLEKTASTALVEGTSEVLYTYKITNNGSVPLTDIVVTDDNGTPASPADDLHWKVPDLAPGQMYTITYVKVLSAGSYDNTFNTLFGFISWETLDDGNPATNDDVRIVFVTSPTVNDLVYGAGSLAAGWTKTHTFQSLVGSDQATFYLSMNDPAKDLQFKVDCISPSALYPSGWGTLGVDGGSGAMLKGDRAAIVSTSTAITENLNQSPAYYTMIVDSPINDPNWEYRDIYTVVLSGDWLAANGGLKSAAISDAHNSPTKKAPPIDQQHTNAARVTATSALDPAVTASSWASATVTIRTGGVSSGGQNVSAQGQNSKVLSMKYTGENVVQTQQDPAKIIISGDPMGAPAVHVRAYEAGRPDRIYLDQIVQVGDVFAIDAKVAGSNRLADNIVVKIMDLGGNVLQSIQLHSRGSSMRPMRIGDCYGGIDLVGWMGEKGKTLGQQAPAAPKASNAQVVAMVSGVSGKTLTVQITNNSTAMTSLESLNLLWPGVPNGSLERVKLGTATIHDKATAPPTTLIQTWKGTLAQRSVLIGQTVTLTLEFKNNASTNLAGYGLVLDLGDGPAIVVL